jgi:WXXGXW repeat (2 copies)
MKSFIRSVLLAAALLPAVPALHAQISLGIRIGPPPRPRVVRVLPPNPGPGFLWVEGYWYPQGNHYRWHDGYWTRPPYEGARWIGPHHDGQQFFEGYWEGDRGRFEHDHRWDHDRYRDDRYDDHDHDRDRHDDHHDDHDDHGNHN